MKRFISTAALLTLVLAIVVACASSKNVRKCDGRKGQKTPMGLL